MREDWVECKVGDIFDFLGGGTPSKNESSYWNGNINWASIKDIKGDYLCSTKDKITELGVINSSTNIVDIDEVILATRINPGRPIITKVKTAINQDLKIVRFSNTVINLKFCFFLFKNLEKEVLKLSSGTTVLGINLNNLNSIIFPLPTLPEQRAIIKKIEASFSSLDAGISDLKKAQEQLKIYRQAVLKKAFEGELDNNSVSTKVNKIDATISSTRYLTRLGSVISLQGGYAFKSSEFTSEGIPIVKIANVNLDNINWDEVSYVSNERLEEFKNYSLTEGDVLIAMTRPVIKSLNTVKTVIVKRSDLPCLLNQRVGRFLIKGNKITKEYLQYYIKSTFFKDPIVREANDSLLPNISGKTIENFDIILPLDFNEQAQIVKDIEARLSVCDAVEKQIQDSLAQAEALRQSILKKAFEGRLLSEEELMLCKQAPDYEPASVLLEKIKAEKEANKPVKKKSKKN